MVVLGSWHLVHDKLLFDLSFSFSWMQDWSILIYRVSPTLPLGISISAHLPTQVNTPGLVRESNIDAKWRVDVAGRSVLLLNGLELLELVGVERDEFAVLVDAAGRDGLGEDGRVAGDWNMSATIQKRRIIRE